MNILKVSSKSNPNMVAGALAGVIRESGAAELQAIGAGAVNQAVKAVAIARSFFEGTKINLVCIPAFIDINIDGEDKTAIKFSVESLPAAEDGEGGGNPSPEAGQGEAQDDAPAQ